VLASVSLEPGASLEPGELLALAKALELAAGRRRGARFGPRPLDIDLLLYGDLQISTPELTLPHPRLRERRFVLEPLAEIAPDLRIPPDGARVRDLLARLPPLEKD
jgi:2-amino-4-hydroxy-6-hydroxymethyldihydropteridine diphosphokinase